MVLRRLSHPAWKETEQAKTQVQWRKGDSARDLKPVYGGQTLEKFAETMGVDYATLRRYRWVTEQYENVVRTTNLSWSHHDRIAARDDRLEWLAPAVAEGSPKLF